MIELATFKLRASIEFHEEQAKLNKSKQYPNRSLRNENKIQSAHLNLKTMTRDIIDNKDLKCETSHEKHKQYQYTLSEGRVNARVAKWKSYMKSLYDVIYPEETNSKKQ